MYKVIFIIVPSCSNSSWLNDKMLQITEAFINILNVDYYPIEIVNSYQDIGNFLDKAELLVVFTAGNVIIERDHLWNKIKNFPTDVGLMAHLLQYKEDITPYFHEQFFIINTKAIKELKIDKVKQSDVGIELIRSEEDLHDGHAPLFVTLGNKKVKRHLQFGTKLIEEVLYNGFEVRNFDLSWRYPPNTNQYTGLALPTRGYCYPNKATELFETSLKNLKTVPGLDPSQEIFINTINKVLEFKVLNAWHYETIEDMHSYDVVLAPATGFLAELLAYKSNAKKIIFFDKNFNNLDFKKHLYAEWNGIDYETFYTAWARKHDLNIEPSFDIDKEKSLACIEKTNKYIFRDWDNWRKNIQIEYYYGDIVNSNFVDLIEQSSIVHTSTILGIYPFTAIVHERSAIENLQNRLLKKIKETNSTWIEA